MPQSTTISRSAPACLRLGRRALPVAALSMVVLLSGCGGDPWIDSRREAGTLTTVGASHPDRPAICYAGSLADNGAEVQKLADQVCAKTNRHARYLGSSYWQCRLITPHRAYFACE